VSWSVLVRGVGDVGSAVAHRLFGAGFAVLLHDGPQPSAPRRGMAFADAVFDGRAVLAGVEAVRADDLALCRDCSPRVARSPSSSVS
jgi:xanthine dehydrogenase accessory factor